MNVEKTLQKQQQSDNIVFQSYIMKMKGNQRIQTNVKLGDTFISASGGLIAITVISFIAVMLGYPMILGPMGASCLLVFAAHSLPFSQPRQIFGGHLVSTSTSLVIWNIFGKSHLSIGLTLAIVLFLMIILKLIHPPAAASAMVAINTEAGWGFLISIILSSILLILISVLYNNLFKNRQYPKQWI
ncbi:MAG TPA: HPP family protein [Metabacillus sp.]|nr:HPP family protein [Metabacillus sp.]